MECNCPVCEAQRQHDKRLAWGAAAAALALVVLSCMFPG